MSFHDGKTNEAILKQFMNTTNDLQEEEVIDEVENQKGGNVCKLEEGA